VNKQQQVADTHILRIVSRNFLVVRGRGREKTWCRVCNYAAEVPRVDPVHKRPILIFPRRHGHIVVVVVVATPKRPKVTLAWRGNLSSEYVEK